MIIIVEARRIHAVKGSARDSRICVDMQMQWLCKLWAAFFSSEPLNAYLFLRMHTPNPHNFVECVYGHLWCVSDRKYGQLLTLEVPVSVKHRVRSLSDSPLPPNVNVHGPAQDERNRTVK